jgi:hypothetical protein
MEISLKQGKLTMKIYFRINVDEIHEQNLEK